MKKQQTPIVLISLLVVFGGAAIALRNRPTDATPEPPKDETKITGETRSAVSQKELTAALDKSTGKTKKSIAALEPEDEKRMSDPAILLPETPDYKPQPNETAASSQWFKNANSAD